MPRLSEDDIRARMAGLSGWGREGDGIRKVFVFDSFASAIAFVNEVAGRAEAADHHPDILVEYTRVTLTLTSHDVAGLSERDFRLAAAIDLLRSPPPGP
jgi:4a-hydroxytetrahydrobiopterin dehydratase